MKRPPLEVKKRNVLGRKVKKLRREGILPANLYGKNIKSQALEVPLGDFQKIYEEVGETGLLDLKIDSQVRPVLVHNVQLDPVSGKFLHVDFHQVSLTEKTTAIVPIEFIGEAPAVEQKIGILIQPLTEIEVEALPQDLPESLKVNISGLTEVDQAVTVADLQVEKEKIEIKADPLEVVAKIEPLAKEEVPPPPAEEVPAEEVPPEGVEAPPEGEVPAEGVPPTKEAKPEEKPASATALRQSEASRRREATAGKPVEEKK